jgi:hypothetical protein
MKKAIFFLCIFCFAESALLASAHGSRSASAEIAFGKNFGKKKRYKAKKKKGFLGLFGKRNQCNCPKN